MVRIDPTGSVGRARSLERARTTTKGRAGKSSRASFARSLSEASGAEAVEVLEAAAETEMAGDIGLLALQERRGESGAERGTRSRAIAYGEGLIERLQDLHVRLLSGVVSEAELLRLESYFAEDGNGVRAVEDEKLRSILGEIELRVQVELAKKRR